MKDELMLWSALEAHESTALETNRRWLSEVEPAIAVLHDLPNALTELPGFSVDREALNAAAMCLKRSLDDLRAMWLLLNQGYTASAAAVCADLWEHAMLASCSCLSDAVAEHFQKDEPDDLSLGPKALAETLAALIADGMKDSRAVDEKEVRRWGASDYATYKWLCQAKHPTLRALRHTSRTSLTEDGVFGLTAMPDASAEDQALKRGLLVVAFGVISETALLLGVAAIGEKPSEEVDAWKAELNNARDLLQKQCPAEELNLPWTIGDTKAGKLARELSGEKRAE